jgi:hypothetical protein
MPGAVALTGFVLLAPATAAHAAEPHDLQLSDGNVVTFTETSDQGGTGALVSPTGDILSQVSVSVSGSNVVVTGVGSNGNPITVHAIEQNGTITVSMAEANQATGSVDSATMTITPNAEGTLHTETVAWVRSRPSTTRTTGTIRRTARRADDQTAHNGCCQRCDGTSR